MGISKAEVNLRRLLEAAPQQQNQAKLIHYVATLREQLEQLAAETTPDGLQRISKAKVSDYSEKIEALAAKLAAETPVTPESLESFDGDRVKEIPPRTEQDTQIPSPRLRRRLCLKNGYVTYMSHAKVEDKSHDVKETDSATPIKLDAETHAHIEKHRKLQEDLTDEMVGLAQRLKESSLMMSCSVQDKEKTFKVRVTKVTPHHPGCGVSTLDYSIFSVAGMVLESTERAVEHSLASTGNANARAMEIYSRTFTTTCFTWLLIFVMTCVFIMVVLLIRVT